MTNGSDQQRNDAHAGHGPDGAGHGPDGAEDGPDGAGHGPDGVQHGPDGPRTSDTGPDLGVGGGVDPEGRLRAGRHARGLAGFVLFLGVLGAGVGIGLLIHQLTQPGGSVAVTVPDPTVIVETTTPEGLPPGTSLDLAESLDQVRLQVDELPAILRAASEAAPLLAGILALVGALLLRRILLEIGAGRPFAPVVSRRLAGLAVVVLAAAILPGAVESGATVLVLEHLGDDGADSPIGFTILSLDLLPFLAAALLGIASQVFRHGQRLTEELEGLV